MVKLILFVFAVIGMTNIMVDPATIFRPVREYVSKNPRLTFLNGILSCYQCCGTWVGFLCGYIFITHNIFEIFLCGMAGSYLATLSAMFFNYLEAKTIISSDE